MRILVLGWDDLTDSFIFSGDGATKSSAFIDASHDSYAKNSAFSLVKGDMYIFGGQTDFQKAKIILQKFLNRTKYFRSRNLKIVDLMSTLFDLSMSSELAILQLLLITEIKVVYFSLSVFFILSAHLLQLQSLLQKLRVV